MMDLSAVFIAALHGNALRTAHGTSDDNSASLAAPLKMQSVQVLAQA
jgi:hypothetical protein